MDKCTKHTYLSASSAEKEKILYHMIVVADSGSTKCDWYLLADTGDISAKTQGFNPMFHNSQFVEQKLRENEHLASNSQHVTSVFYYGAGCQNEELCETIASALRGVFPNANIHVDHDLTAAVHATCQGKPGISCILGTGSNSAYFDGEKVHSRVSGLGYILGDEGSGSYFGKKLISAYLYGHLPERLSQKLESLGLTKTSILESVYMKPNANVYLASHMKFVSQHQDDPYINRMIYAGLADFIDLHIWNYPEHKNVPVHFVGSVAYYNKDILAKACENHRLQLGRIVQKPIVPLIQFHRESKEARA